jgi:predicted CXXCH cytochrome family protein
MRASLAWRLSAIAFGSLSIWGCRGDTGTQGTPGAACWDLDANGACDVASEDKNGDGVCDVGDCQPVLFGTLRVQVTDAASDAVAGATVITAPATATETTDAQGVATFVDLPLGAYTVYVNAAGYDSAQEPASVAAGLTSIVAITLDEAASVPPTVTTIDQYQVGYGRTVTLTATAVSPNHPASTLSYRWEQAEGPPVTLSGADTATPSFTTGALADLYGDLPSRFGVLPIFPEVAGGYVFDVTVTDPSGATATASVTVRAAENTTGLPDVPVGIRVYLVAAAAGSHSWTLVVPPGSTATLSDGASRLPSFVPDQPGTYSVTETVSGDTMDLRAGMWLGILGNESTCTGCHNGVVAPDKFTSWAGTGHATFFSRQIDGVPGQDETYEAGCVGCHTVGYSLAAQNGGFADVAATLGWTFPETLQAGNWASLESGYPGLARLANIQCESCHGPQISTAHMTGAARTSLASELCASCHGEADSVYPLLWRGSPHANLEMAQGEATVESRGAFAAHCGRCHAGQGFLAYLDQLDNGTAATASLRKPDGSPADVGYLGSLGLTRDQVQPETCATCHDPHDATNPHQLRVFDSQTLAAGFDVAGVGEGALCMTCHNTRSGAHGADAGDPPDYSAPHVAAQADVFMGKSAYYVTGSRLSGHAVIQDTCVTCHVRLLPASVPSFAPSNHTFEADTTICVSCHGDGVTGAPTQTAVLSEMDELASALGTALANVIAGQVAASGSFAVRAWDPATDLYSSSSSGTANVTIDQAPTAAEPVSIHGQQGFTVTLPSDVTFQLTNGDFVTTNKVSFQLGSLFTQTGGAALVSPASDIVRAGWNYYLVLGDGSRGIHNPSFVFEILDASLSAL